MSKRGSPINQELGSTLFVRGDGYVVALVALLASLVTLPFNLTWAPTLLCAVGVAGLIRANLPALLVLSMPTYALLGVMISSSLIESGMFIREQFRSGYIIGATGLLGVYVLAFLIVGHLLTVFLTRKLTIQLGAIPKLRKTYLALLSIALLLVGTALVAVIVVFGTAAATGGDRFYYWKELPGPVNSVIIASRTYLLPALAAGVGMYVTLFRRHWVVLAIMLAIPHVALYLMGEKMSAFASTLFAVLFGVGLGAVATRNRLRINGAAIVVLAVIGVGILGTTLLGFDRTSTGDAGDAFVDRMVLQGHVWFGVLDMGNGEAFIDARALASRDSMESPSGLNLLSYYITDPNYVWSRAQYGLTFTMGGPPAHLAAFGAITGCVTFASMSLAYSLCAAASIYFVRVGDILSTFATLILLPILTNVVLMGFWDDIYNPVALSVYVWVFGALVFHQLRRSRRFRRMVASGIRSRQSSKNDGAMHAPAIRP